MAGIEFYGKLRLAKGTEPQALALVSQITDLARDLGQGVLRCDGFASPAAGECITMTAIGSDEAAESFFGLAAGLYAQLSAFTQGEVIFLGHAPLAAVRAMQNFRPRVFEFAFGLAPTPQRRPAPGIEVYTLFDIHEGHGDPVRRIGSKLVSIVKAKDPGTTRYDWFFSEDDRQCIAMDSYADAPSMFAHMKNAHDIHEGLFGHATMKVEFLGELPPPAREAVAKYNPYVLPLYCGLS